MAKTMKAWQYTSVAGGMEQNLFINDAAPRPTPGDKELLVQVHAMALNPVDYKVTESGAPLRLLGPVFTPGSDYCGTVADVGKSVQGFTKGQYVFGCKVGDLARGTLAQYIVVKAEHAAVLPAGMDAQAGATVGICGLTEMQALAPHVEAGDKVFINGGSGGTGTYGVQIAKALGCHVTTTCSTANVQLCRDLGADDVLDYKTVQVLQALADKGRVFNLVVDNIGAPANLYRASNSFLVPGGRFVQVGMTPSLRGMLQVGGNVLRPAFLGGGKAKYHMLMAQASQTNLQQLAQWLDEGKIKPVVDEVFEWEDAPKAYAKQKLGRVKGKIVIKVPQDKE
ncbi:hypothetical protein ACEQ8H_008719 [Pleosporales sp. CAS-2024a]